jgi:hypothetical protein
MAKKVNKTRVDESRTLYTCGSCGWGIWDTSHHNMDMDGKPICLVCKWEEKRKRIRSESACEHWKRREEKL